MSIQQGREHWGSKIGFILAAAGSAIGLGNIWKFHTWPAKTAGAHLSRSISCALSYSACP